MLPIIGSAVPSSTSVLQTALKEGFAQYGLATRKVEIEGDALSDIQRLSIDLSGANVTRDARPPQPGKPQEEVAAAQNFALVADPILLEGVPARLSVKAADMGLATATGGNHLFLVPQRAKDGHLHLEIERTALESLVQKAASELAGKQGVEIKETHLEFTSRGGRELSFRAEVVGKVFVMKAPVTLTGDVAIDDDLNLHLSNLTVGGSGMIANMASGFAQPYLKKIQEQPISLGMFTLGSLKLRDIQLAGGDRLRLEARFGS